VCKADGNEQSSQLLFQMGGAGPVDNAPVAQSRAKCNELSLLSHCRLNEECAAPDSIATSRLKSPLSGDGDACPTKDMREISGRQKHA